MAVGRDNGITGYHCKRLLWRVSVVCALVGAVASGVVAAENGPGTGITAAADSGSSGNTAVGDAVADTATGDLGDARNTSKADAKTCRTLDAETLGELTIGMESVYSMQAGQTRTFELGTIECCRFFKSISEVCATWSVSPAAGASMNATTGVLSVDPSVAAGTVYTVEADIESGRRTLSADVHIWDPDANPLAGTWTEATQLECADGGKRAPEQHIEELRFTPDGRVEVTWTPFETYVDYWGRYTFDGTIGDLTLDIEGGNYVPDDTDVQGTYEIDAQGRLVLRKMWLGTPSEGSAAPACGHVFE